MAIVFGTRLFGKVDHVPGLFYVATTFGHVCSLPLVPASSFLVIDETEAKPGFRGVRIPTSGKSVLAAYLRTGLMIAAIGFLVAGIIAVSLEAATGAILMGASVAALLAMVLSYRLSRPGKRRAVWLAQQANIDPEVVLQYLGVASAKPRRETVGA